MWDYEAPSPDDGVEVARRNEDDRHAPWHVSSQQDCSVLRRTAPLSPAARRR